MHTDDNKCDHESLHKAFHLACEVAKEVGELLKQYLEDPQLMTKREEADLLAEQMIRHKLTTAFPGWGFRAEEEPELNEVVDSNTPFWLVDPNDGTSAFLKGERGASVAIALIHYGKPVLGIVNAYGAPNGLGDLFTWAQDVSPLQRNGQELSSEWETDWAKATIFVSNSADRIAPAYREALASSGSQYCQYRVAPGVAYRLALCAAGEGEVAISLASPRDFDFAAGHALLIGAGGTLLDERGQEVTYLHHRPNRLGFAFGGEPTLTKQAVDLNWNATFLALAEKNLSTVPFIAPQQVSLCTNSDLLDRAQGAWWGWHCGHLSQKLGTKLLFTDLPAQIRKYGGDQKLILEVREVLSIGQSLEQDSVLIQFLEALKVEYSNKAKLLGDWSQVLTPAAGALWGAIHGRKAIHSRVISSFLGWRIGEMSHWQPDGDRLVEQLLSFSPMLEESLLSIQSLHQDLAHH